MSDRHDPSREARYAKAMRLADEYRRRQADGTAEPLEQFLRAHPDVQRELEALLADATVLPSGERSPPRASGQAPSTIGPYRILSRLGWGGMGTVYLAERRDPEQRVALKVIRRRADSAALVAHFDSERKALAKMNHDAIAKVFDAGTTDGGEPYFVMELVENGTPLTAYCDARGLSISERIRLFQQVCDGVQHAHLKGVVHRDLKPSNVLIAPQGEHQVVKIIDFGIAGPTIPEADTTDCTQRPVGTPEYMSPEQAAGDPQLIDSRTDVYSLGVMLYELLTGELPFASEHLRDLPTVELQQRIRDSEPQRPSTKITTSGDKATTSAHARGMSVAALAKTVRGDLDWIVLKAMAKDPERRYATPGDLTLDLQRYLSHEPVRAAPSSAMYRLRKFARRYRGQVLAGVSIVATAMVGAVVAIDLARDARSQARANAKLAGANGELAAAESAAKNLLQDKVREYDLLSGVVLHERALARELHLYPAWPSKIAAMQAWLGNDAGPLLAMRPEVERAVRVLAAPALPLTPEEMEADRRSHPQFSEFELLTKRFESMRYAQGIREGKELVVHALTSEQKDLDSSTLSKMAWARVAPTGEERSIYGEEAFGLACALAAVEAVRPEMEFQFLDTLAFAWLANGRDATAVQTMNEAVQGAWEQNKQAYRSYERQLLATIRDAAATLSSAEKEIADLAIIVNVRRTFRLERESEQFLHDELAKLLLKLGSLESKQRAQVEARLAWASRIQELTLHHPNAGATWDDVRAGLATGKRYADHNIDLRAADVTGLVPIGMNPVTELWEFYELRSAWDGTKPPDAIPIPAHKPDGTIDVTGDTGVVFVLLPGGTFTMGAQRSADNPNFDPSAQGDETPHEMTLGPFFLARHELTQGQWARLWSGAEDSRWPSLIQIGSDYAGASGLIGASSPVDNVSWQMCDTLLRQSGLLLPTEAQWEFGCRGGQSTPWYTGDQPISLAGHANVLDQTAKQHYPDWGTPEAFEDGFCSSSPAGYYAGMNAFGLHDVHGNLWEWCRDRYLGYVAPWQTGDGERLGVASAENRVFRGGSSQNLAASARSSCRSFGSPSFRGNLVGLRPARRLKP